MNIFLNLLCDAIKPMGHEIHFPEVKNGRTDLLQLRVSFHPTYRTWDSYTILSFLSALIGVFDSLKYSQGWIIYLNLSLSLSHGESQKYLEYCLCD